MGLGKWLEQIGEKVGDVALKATGQPTTAAEAEKKIAKEKAEKKSKPFPYSAAGDAARKEQIEKETK